MLIIYKRCLKTITYFLYCVYGAQNVEEAGKALYLCKTCKCASVYVYAGWAAVPMYTLARTNSIKQNIPQESDFHPARVDVTQIFITPFAKTAAGLYPHQAYSVYYRQILVPFVST